MKANALMVAIVLFLIKPYLMAAASVIYAGHGSVLDAFYTNKLYASLEAVAAIPVLLLMYAWSRRLPGASRRIRQICNNGKTLIIITALLQLGITSSILLSSGTTMSPGNWVQILLFIAVIIVTASSSYMKNCFADFPEEHNENQSG